MNVALSAALIATAMLFPRGPMSLAAMQSARDSLRAGTETYQETQFDRAVTLLAYGLNPVVLPVDSHGLTSRYSLADAFLQTGRAPLAATWLRKARRHHTPRPLRVDDTQFPRAVVTQLEEAAAAVRSSQGDDSLGATGWVRPATPRAPNALGALRLAANPVGVPLRATVELAELLSYGELPRGQVRFFPAGMYTVTVSVADVPTPVTGLRRAQVSGESLPGVVTELYPRFVPALGTVLSERETVLYVLSKPTAAVFSDGKLAGAAQATPPNRGERAGVGAKEVNFVSAYRLAPKRHSGDHLYQRVGALTEHAMLPLPHPAP